MKTRKAELYNVSNIERIGLKEALEKGGFHAPAIESVLRAVNAHEELVKALHSAIGYMHGAGIELSTIKVFQDILTNAGKEE